MEVFLSKITQQALNYAIRSGITVTATYAFRQSSRLLKRVDGEDREELRMLQERLQSKIRIISPAIDMIELIAARGNTSLESAVFLTKAIRWDIQQLGHRLAKVVSDEAIRSRSSKNRAHIEAEIKAINKETRALLGRIEDAVPLINLAITTSGVSLSTSLPQSVSPSRLLQASTFLTAGDTQYSISSHQTVQVGPTFTLSVYLLFAGHVRPQDEGVRNTTWKEAIRKARVKLQRVPMGMVLPDAGPAHSLQNHFREHARGDEFAYRLLIIEDLDDDRVHDDDDTAKPGYFEGVEKAGIRETIPIHQISKIFYADTGKILNIGSEGENNNPVLLLKRDVDAIPPRRMMDRGEAEDGYFACESEGDEEPEEHDQDDHATSNTEEDILAQLDAQLMESAGALPGEETTPDAYRFPPGLDLEWIAFEVYQGADDSGSETESGSDTEDRPSTPHSPSAGAQLTEKMDRLRINGKKSSPSPSTLHGTPSDYPDQHAVSNPNPTFSNIRTSLSLLETLLRLTSLQQFQQQSHLSITDELLNFFLEESSTTGAGGDEHHRQRVRAEARRKVGWDPYDESPLKRRGEEYQYQVNDEGGWEEGAAYRYSAPGSVRSTFDRRSMSARVSPNVTRMGGPGSPSPASSSSDRLRHDGRGNGGSRRQLTRRSLRREVVHQSIEQQEDEKAGGK